MSGVDVARFRSHQPLAAKLSTSVRDFGSASIPPDQGLGEQSDSRSLLAMASCEQFVVRGIVAPQKVRQPRGQFPVVEHTEATLEWRVRRSGRFFSGRKRFVIRQLDAE